MAKTGRPITKQGKAAAASRASSRKSYQSKTLAEKKAVVANRDSEAQRQADARRLAETPPPMVIRCLPTRASEQVAPHSQRLQRVVLIAATPLMVCGVAFALGWWLLASRRSSRTIEDYTRQLRARSVSADAPRSSH